MGDVSRTVRCSVDQVSAVLADAWLYPLWVVGATSIRGVEGAWPAAGSRLHHTAGAWPVVLQDCTRVLVDELPRRLVLDARGWPLGRARVEVRLEPWGAGCSRVTLAEDVSAGPGLAVPAAVRQLALVPRNRESLRRLATVAEKRGPRPPQEG